MPAYRYKSIVNAQPPSALSASLPPFPLSRAKILKNFCVGTPRRSVGSLNATVSIIKVDTVSLIIIDDNRYKIFDVKYK